MVSLITIIPIMNQIMMVSQTIVNLKMMTVIVTMTTMMTMMIKNFKNFTSYPDFPINGPYTMDVR